MPVLRSQADNTKQATTSGRSPVEGNGDWKDERSQASEGAVSDSVPPAVRRSRRLDMAAGGALNGASVLDPASGRGRGRGRGGRRGRAGRLGGRCGSEAVHATDSLLVDAPATSELPETSPNAEATHSSSLQIEKGKEEAGASPSLAIHIPDSPHRLHELSPQREKGQDQAATSINAVLHISDSSNSLHGLPSEKGKDKEQADASFGIAVHAPDSPNSLCETSRPKLQESFACMVSHAVTRYMEAVRLSESVPSDLHAEDFGRRRKDTTRARFLSVAKKRAAHFAYFDDPENERPSKVKHQRQQGDSSSIAVQPSIQSSAAEYDWPGPFSTARKLVQGRAAAAAARQEAGKVDAEVSLVEWQPSAVARVASPSHRTLPSLHDLCVKFLCANMDHVESLYGVPESTKSVLSARLCECRKMNGNVLVLFFSGEPSEIRVPDCSLVTEQELMEMMKKCRANSLEVLELRNCGRGLSDNCLGALVTLSSGLLPVLHTLTLRGAYRLTDSGLAITKFAPGLTSLDLSDCSCFSEAGIQDVVDAVGANLKSLILDGCKQLDCVKLLPILLKVRQLQKLSLAHMASMTDEIATELALQLGPCLQELCLAYCSSITDAALAAIGACCSELKSLCLDCLQLLTDASLGFIADGCCSISKLSLNRCKFSDEAISAFVSSSGSLLSELSLNSVKQAANQTLLALSKHAKFSLNMFDASWCRLMSDEGFGCLADSCINLHELTLFGCTQVTQKFLKGHRNTNLRVIGLWEGSGCNY